MLKHSDLFDELPESYHDSAYLDRLHHYIPGWEVDTIRGEMFSNGYGFVVDYIAEVLKSMRVSGLLGPLPAALHAFVRHLDPRPRRRPQDVLRADEDPLPARGGHARGDRGDPAVRDRGPQAGQGPDPPHRLDDGRRQVRLPGHQRSLAPGLDPGGGRVPGLLPPRAPRRCRDATRTEQAEPGRQGSRGAHRCRARSRRPPLFEGHIGVPGEPARGLVRQAARPVPAWCTADHDHRPLHPSVPSGP